MKNKILTYTIGAAAAVAVFLLGWSWGQVAITVAPDTGLRVGLLSRQTPNTVALLINNGQSITSVASLTIPAGEPTVFGALKQAAADKHLALKYDSSSSMGVFVQQIGSQTNGQNKLYWQYWVNGVEPQVAADHYVLKGGETILWSFSSSVF